MHYQTVLDRKFDLLSFQMVCFVGSFIGLVVCLFVCFRE